MGVALPRPGQFVIVQVASLLCQEFHESFGGQSSSFALGTKPFKITQSSFSWIRLPRKDRGLPFADRRKHRRRPTYSLSFVLLPSVVQVGAVANRAMGAGSGTGPRLPCEADQMRIALLIRADPGWCG